MKSMHWLMAGAAGGSTCWCFAQGGSDTREGTGYRWDQGPAACVR